MKAPALALLIALELLGQGANSVEGTVADKFTGAQVGGVLVELRRLNVVTLTVSPAVYSATSDEQGRFRFEPVAEGDYVPAYVKSGFVAHLSSATPSDNRWYTEDSITAPIFHVDSSAAHVKLNASLEPIAELSGRVVNEDGQPIARMSVSAMSANGRTILGGRETDSEGRYKFSAPAGSYFLFAMRRKLDEPNGRLVEGLHFWYPGVIQLEESPVIRVSGGVQSYDIKIRSLSSHNVRGVVLAALGSEPVPGVTVTLFQPASWEEVTAWTTTGKDGSFQFDGVPDGSWGLFARIAGDPLKRVGYTEIPVSKRDTENIQVRLALPFSMNGRIEQDDDAQAPAVKAITLFPMDFPFRGQFGMVTGQREADGRFRISGAYAARYRILADPIASKYYLASILVGEREVLGEPVELREGTPEIRAVYRSDGGMVQGSVGKCVNATVALVPTEEALFNLFLRKTQCDLNGRFALSNVRPGNYYVIALRDGSALRDESYVRSLFAWAETGRVKSCEIANVELRGVTPVQ